MPEIHQIYAEKEIGNALGWGEPLQVSLQLQLLQLLSDLQHEQAIAATRIKERDRAIKRMKEVEVEVDHLHSQLPVYKQEKEKASREVKNQTHSQDDLCKTLPIL
jgi:hypothetical protein